MRRFCRTGTGTSALRVSTMDQTKYTRWSSHAACCGSMEKRMSNVDGSAPVRRGEELPIERLVDYLSSHLPELNGPPIVEQFPAGFSNLTYLLLFGNRELVLRRPPIGAKIKTAHDMNSEHRILSHLYPVYKKVPRPLLFCDDESIFGAPFYVMERVTGIILRAKPPAEIDLSPDVMRALSETFI